MPRRSPLVPVAQVRIRDHARSTGTATTEPPAGADTDRRRIIEALEASLPPYLLSRVLVLGALVFVLVLLPSGGNRSLSSLLTVWDGQWYVSVAQHGYLPGPDVIRPGHPGFSDTRFDGAVAYLPLYPLLIAATADIPGISFDLAAILVASITGALAALAFARLAVEVIPPAAARRSVLLFCFFPGAFILSFAYPEGLLIALGCVCLLALQRHRWIAAGVTAALASATRSNGLALTVACAVACVIAIRDDGDRSSLWAPILAPTGFLAYMGYLWWRSGHPLYWFTANRRYWHDFIGSWPEVRALLGRSDQIMSTPDRVLLFGGLFVGCLFLAGLVILMFRARLPASFTAYALAYEVLAFLPQALAPRPRFILAAFPLVLALGVEVRGTLFRIVLPVFGAGMVVLTVFYSWTFARGHFLVAP